MDQARVISALYGSVLITLTASLCTFLYAFSNYWDVQDAEPVSTVRTRDAPSPWAIEEVVSAPVSSLKPLPDILTPPRAPEEGAQRFALRHPDYGDATILPLFDVIVGGPGIYPPIKVLSDESGEFEVSLDVAQMLNGEQAESLEVFVRERRRGRAGAIGLWRELELSELEDGACEYGFMCKILPLWDVLPMSVRVRTQDGQRVMNARVKLSQDSVGLVHLKERVNSGGDVFFGGIPEGNYTLTIKAAGYLSEEFEISHVRPEGALQDDDLSGEMRAHEVMLEEGKSLYGRVVDGRGEGVVGAFVTVYVDRYGSPEMLSVESFSRIDSVPVRGVATAGEDGYFAVSGLPRGIAYVTAMGTLGMPALSDPLDLREVAEIGPVDVVLEEGSNVEVMVVGDSGAVAGVEVSWRDKSTGLQASFVTTPDGAAVFEDVPPGALFSASYNHWFSPERGLEAPDEDGVYRLDMELEKPGEREDVRLRLLTPLKQAIGIESISFRAADGSASCPGTKQERRDWMFAKCKPQQGWLQVRTTTHGLWSELIELDHGVIVTMPEPVATTVTWRDWPEPPASITVSDANGELLQRWPTQVLDRRGEHRRWEGVLYPGSYRVGVDTSADNKTLSVARGEPNELVWKPVAEHTMRVDVVDERDHPLRESYFAVVRQGRHADVRENNASHIVPLSGRDVGKTTLLACGVNSGCAMHVIVSEDMTRERLLMRTSGEVLKGVAYPGVVSDEVAASEVLGVPVVRDNWRLLLDVKGEQSVAAKLGVPRGAALIFLSAVPSARSTSSARYGVLVLLANRSWRWISKEL